jgi:hypothetical protein
MSCDLGLYYILLLQIYCQLSLLSYLCICNSSRSLDSDSFKPFILFFLPWVTKLFPGLSGWNRFLSSFKAIFPVLVKYIEEHRANLDPLNPKDFIDIYLNHVDSIKDPNSSFFRDQGGIENPSIFPYLLSIGYITVYD